MFLNFFIQGEKMFLFNYLQYILKQWWQLNENAYLVYIELLVMLYLVAYGLTFDGHKSCVLQHISNFTVGPKSKYEVAKSPLPHHFVPEKKFKNGISITWFEYYVLFVNTSLVLLRRRKLFWCSYKNLLSLKIIN